MVKYQFLCANVQFILVPSHFRLVPPLFGCYGDGTAPWSRYRVSINLIIRDLTIDLTIDLTLGCIYTGEFFACDFLIKMDVAQLHISNNGSHCDKSYLTVDNDCLKLFLFR